MNLTDHQHVYNYSLVKHDEDTIVLSKSVAIFVMCLIVFTSCCVNICCIYFRSSYKCDLCENNNTYENDNTYENYNRNRNNSINSYDAILYSND